MSQGTLLHKISASFSRLSSREKQLVSITVLAAVLIAVWGFYVSYTSLTKSHTREIDRLKIQLQDVEQLAEKHLTLKASAQSIRNKYLSSTLSYEKLTQHLDSLIKSLPNKSSYDLSQAQGTIDGINGLQGTIYQLRVKEIDQKSLLLLLKGLEFGSPPLFLQKVDIKKQAVDKVQLTVEIAIFNLAEVQESFE